ncbi:Fe2+/Zn2+ uptake regulation protein-like protein [Kribbella flavida DSM 17836]|uniref:Fe2+/Zn2+ uptake regulation protein-like protein n=1 Tax=Kribbella flavida (strain DSM 17836 / JCM 10339 / NBRC 14399) TaxID=479435 RepID=D2PSI2_KRIFD|nr:transcriptional repressor [Kribbella flavida]ADB33120.1 Fe2+/Zn2+ uptake regulation protein-like protein [Kribbella flavida DSM 17836]
MRDADTTDEEDLSAADVGLRRTRQRAAMLDTLSNCRDFVSVGELHALLQSTGTPIGLTTVYRALRHLERSDRVDVIRDEAGTRGEQSVPGHSAFDRFASCSWLAALASTTAPTQGQMYASLVQCSTALRLPWWWTSARQMR